MKNDPKYDLKYRAFLDQTYNLKDIADDGTGPGSNVTEAQAKSAIATAHAFVAHLSILIED